MAADSTFFCALIFSIIQIFFIFAYCLGGVLGGGSSQSLIFVFPKQIFFLW